MCGLRVRADRFPYSRMIVWPKETELGMEKDTSPQRTTHGLKLNPFPSVKWWRRGELNPCFTKGCFWTFAEVHLQSKSDQRKVLDMSGGS
jgi:hypothetical protein